MVGSCAPNYWSNWTTFPLWVFKMYFQFLFRYSTASKAFSRLLVFILSHSKAEQKCKLFLLYCSPSVTAIFKAAICEVTLLLGQNTDSYNQKAFFILLLETLQADYWELKQKLWQRHLPVSLRFNKQQQKSCFKGFASSLGRNLPVFLLHSFSSFVCHGSLRWPHWVPICWEQCHSKQSSSFFPLRELLGNNIRCSVLDNWPEQSVYV